MSESADPQPAILHRKADLKLALFAAPHTPEHVEVIREAERLGYDSIWGGENYGSDAFTPMGWWAAQTTTIKLCTIVAIVDARTPAATAMAAMTLDQLSGGRYTLGLGVSGPAVLEGFYGKPFSKPLARTREYVEVIRKIMAREQPVIFAGKHYQLPYNGPDASGLGKPLKTILHPVRPRQPIFIAAEGPKNVALTAEIADGWTAFYISPHSDAYYRARLEEGFALRPGGRPLNFEVVGQIHFAVGDDVESAADPVRQQIAFMVGGMGAPGTNFHYDAMARIGFEAECARIHQLWSDGDRKAAAASVPLKMVESVALVGPMDKIRSELETWRATCVTTLLPMVTGVPVDVAFVRRLAEIVFR
jgi:F420-dependent oxidoreductase-like protein